MKKNLFLFPALVLTAFLCFITAACSSGYEEKGEVSFTFTEPMLRQISRSARAGDTDYSNLYPGFEFPAIQGSTFTNDNILMSYAGTSEDVEDTFILLVYKDGNFSVYSNELMSKESKNNPFMQGGDDDENDSSGIPDFSDPAYQEFKKNPYSILDDALVSKGTWTQSGDNITITETHYRDIERGNLMPVEQASPVTISLSASTFTVDSKAGYKIQFYKTSASNPDINIPDLDDDSDDENEDDLPDHPSELPDNKGENDSETDDLEDIKIKVELKVDGNSYYKEINEKGRISPDWKTSVEFKNLRIGATAQVLADVYISDEVHIEGKSDSFVISQGKNNVSVVMKYKILPNDNPDNPDKPDNPVDKPDNPQGNPQDNLTPPSGQPTGFLMGIDKETEKEYMLMRYKNDLYLIIDEDENPVSFGTLKITENNTGEKFSYSYEHEETAYYKNGKWVKSDRGSSGGNQGKISIRIITGAGPDITFEQTEVVETETLYSATGSVPDDYKEEKQIFNGLLYFYAYDDYTYEIVGDTYDQNIQPLGQKLFAKGSWKYAADNEKNLTLTETDYFDFEKNKIVTHSGDFLNVDLTKSEFEYNGWSAVPITFRFSNYEEPPLPEYDTSGDISFDNKVLTIEIDNTEFTEEKQLAVLTAKTQDGQKLDKEHVSFEAQILYKGRDVTTNGMNMEYYLQNGNEVEINYETFQPGQYQLYVVAYTQMDLQYLYNSQTFTITVSE